MSLHEAFRNLDSAKDQLRQAEAQVRVALKEYAEEHKLLALPRAETVRAQLGL